MVFFTMVEKTETRKDKLCSILAQFEYAHRILQWEEGGIEFKTHMYVPEVHPETHDVFYEREDEAHVLKVNIYVYIHSVCTSCASVHTYNNYCTCMCSHLVYLPFLHV